jgi:hypothetical protein
MLYLSPTLLDSFYYFLRMRSEDAQKKARDDLIKRLRGKKEPPNDAMQYGLDFEADVLLSSVGQDITGTPKYIQCVDEVGNIIRGCPAQRRIEYRLEPEIMFTGYIDFLGKGIIYDVKTTRAYTWGKYRNNFQHLVYLLWGHIQLYYRFRYLVLDKTEMKIHTEDYFYNDYMRKALISAVREFQGYMEHDSEMREAFLEHTPYRREENENALGL